MPPGSKSGSAESVTPAESIGAFHMKQKHSHYFKSVKGLDEVDVYRVLQLFEVTDPCLQHAIKKLLVAGGRGGGKGHETDITEAIVSLQRALDMEREGEAMDQAVIDDSGFKMGELCPGCNSYHLAPGEGRCPDCLKVIGACCGGVDCFNSVGIDGDLCVSCALKARIARREKGVL